MTRITRGWMMIIIIIEGVAWAESSGLDGDY